jgi:hypothetical protein
LKGIAFQLFRWSPMNDELLTLLVHDQEEDFRTLERTLDDLGIRTQRAHTCWHFASAQHRDAFVKSPESYAPQYGGYCAYGVSQGHTAPVDPAAWKIINGKLYLNYNSEVQGLFSKDPSSAIERADQNWPRLHK